MHPMIPIAELEKLTDEELRIVQRRLEDFLHACDLNDTDRAHITASLNNIRIMQRTRQLMPAKPAS
ncbi:hypothetical protein [Brucella anthropi]|uniref:hypothetical protein n=1 Tax=Brucella anthropi TaxID=529 RepID=UPI002361FDB4|nr:hypothetical protein [Brucella anthropi]